jgi:hypothetical protein
VPVSRPLMFGTGYAQDPFPVLRISRNLTPWNIHNVNLELMPILDISQPKDLRWLNALVSLQMSDRELAVRQATLADPYMVPSDHVLVSVKDSLHSVLIGFTGLQGPPRRVFSIMDPKNGGGFMILFIQSLRLDLAAFTLVADVAVVPLENAIMPYIGRGLQALHTEEIMQIVASPAEVVAWKRLLPAFVERCRTWSHGQNCEYTSEGRVPRSTKIDENPICSCGRSVGLPKSFPRVPTEAWRILRPYATRAAFSPLYAVSYVEPVASAARDMLKSEFPSTAQSTTEHPGKKTCASCASPGKLVCSRCKKVTYCSAACSKTASLFFTVSSHVSLTYFKALEEAQISLPPDIIASLPNPKTNIMSECVALIYARESPPIHSTCLTRSSRSPKCKRRYSAARKRNG